MTSAGPTIDAPMYWIPGRDNYHWILQSEIDNNTARLIVDMNAAAIAHAIPGGWNGTPYQLILAQ